MNRGKAFCYNQEMTKIAITLVSIFILFGLIVCLIDLNDKAHTPRPIPDQAGLAEKIWTEKDLKTVGYVFDRQMSQKFLSNLKQKVNGIPGVTRVNSLPNQMAIEVTYDPLGISEEQIREYVAKSIKSSRIVKYYDIE